MTTTTPEANVTMPTEKHLATNVYHDRTFNCMAAKIVPGEFFYTSDDMLIVTVLGSCVSACIRDPAAGIGGMNHFMLPDSAPSADPAAPPMRYGGYAMEILINSLLKRGASRANLEAKVFGGASYLDAGATLSVGRQNADFVTRYLRNEGIRIAAEDLKGSYARKVYYFPRTGRVLVKKLIHLPNNTVADREVSYARSIRDSALSGPVHLFKRSDAGGQG